MEHELIDESDIAALKDKLLSSGLSISQLVSTAWASASTFRVRISVAARTALVSAWRPRKIGKSMNLQSSDMCCRPSGKIQADFNKGQKGE